MYQARMKLIIIFSVVTLLLSWTDAAKILVVFPFAAHSHWSIGNALVRGLAAKGHEVTFVTPYAEKEAVKNVKSIFLSEVFRTGEG